MIMYRVFFHTPVSKHYIDIPARNEKQLNIRIKNTLKCSYIIDNIIVLETT